MKYGPLKYRRQSGFWKSLRGTAGREFLSGLLCGCRKEEGGASDRDKVQEWYADTLQFLCTLEPVSPKWPSFLTG